jgi:hypothetical protein
MSMRASSVRLVAVIASVLVGAGLVLVVGPRPAGASCMPPLGVADAIGRADIVVVGTVTSVRSADRIATVRLEERWKGQIADTFEVFGGPEKDNVATSVDRTYVVGLRYLLFVHEQAGPDRYKDNACSTTQRWSHGLTRYRPATATVVHQAPSTPGTSGPRRSSLQVGTRSADPARWPWAVAVFAGVSLLAGILIARHRRRPTSVVPIRRLSAR